MSVQTTYAAWKPTVLGHVLNVDGVDPGQCTQVPFSFGEALFPGVALSTIFPPTPAAKDMGNVHNPAYWEWVANDVNDPGQLPGQGDVMVFDATPKAGYTNPFDNPWGHTGVCDSAGPGGYYLLQQNAPASGQSVNVTYYAWKFRPCLGWLRAILATPAPAPAPVPAGKTLYLPASVDRWRVYNLNGLWTIGHEAGFLRPAMFGGLSYPVLADLGGGYYEIQTRDFGTVAIYGDPNMTDAVIK